MRYLILGSGRMAYGLVHFLKHRDPEARIRVVDRSLGRSRSLADWAGRDRVKPGRVDLTDRKAVARALKQADVAIGAAHYAFNDVLTAEAIKARTHLVDLGGNNDVVARQFKRRAAAEKAGVVVIPDTGLAPGLTNILAHWAVEGWDKTSWVRIRVGGVPVHPEPPLGYQLVFSTEGLINEYVEDAQVMRRGRATTTSSLTEVEPVRFPPPFGLMEAFHTSGGASTLVTTLKGRVKDLDYKTIRYPGHCVRMAVLKDLGLFSDKPRKVGDARVRPRALTAKLLEARLPHEGEDAVLVLVRAEKAGGPQRRRVRIQLIDRFDEETGLTAMARCTAFPSACIAWMIGQGVIDVPGVHAQESVVPARKFIAEMRKAGLRIRRASG